jgi:hypothetical protein
MLNAKNLPKTSGKSKFPPVEPGTYPARLVQIIVAGIQPQNGYEGKDKPPCLEMQHVWELLDEFLPDEDGEPDLTKPRWIRETLRFYSLDQDKATSTKRYYALDPTEQHGGDWSKLLGTPAMVMLIVKKSQSSGNEYNKVSNVSTMRAKEADKAPPLVNAPFVFDFYDPDPEVLATFPDWMVDHFKEAVDYKGSKLEEMISNAPKGDGDLDDEIPFKAKSKLSVEEGEQDDEEGWT